MRTIDAIGGIIAITGLYLVPLWYGVTGYARLLAMLWREIRRVYRNSRHRTAKAAAA